MKYKDKIIILKNNTANFNKKQNKTGINKSLFKMSFNYSKRFIVLFKLFIFLNILINNLGSYITIKVNKEGSQQILGTKFNFCPDEIYINNEKQSNEDCKSIILSDISYQIKLVWNKEINDTSNMFSGLNNIISIDLSHFDSSLVTNMQYMFSSCKNLNFIDLSNIDTSQVTNMGNIFYSCSSLVSIDVSSLILLKLYIFMECFLVAQL